MVPIRYYSLPSALIVSLILVYILAYNGNLFLPIDSMSSLPKNSSQLMAGKGVKTNNPPMLKFAVGALIWLFEEREGDRTRLVPTTDIKKIDESDRCTLSRTYPEKVLQWCDLIINNGNLYGIDPDLLAALIWQESGGNPTAYSHSGAVGLMQVMPRDGIASGFQCPNGPCFQNRPTMNALNEPSFNVDYGTKMLAKLVSQKGGIREALKSYGPADVGYSYADTVLAIYEQNSP